MNGYRTQRSLCRISPLAAASDKLLRMKLFISLGMKPIVNG
jgi:hypothetical protein